MAYIVRRTTSCNSCTGDCEHGVYYILRDSKGNHIDMIGKNTTIKESEVAEAVAGTDITKSDIQRKIKEVDANIIQQKRRPSEKDLRNTLEDYDEEEKISEGSKELYQFQNKYGDERYVINLDETVEKYNRDKQRLIDKNEYIPKLIREFGGKAARTVHTEYNGDEYIVKEGINGEKVEDYDKESLTDDEIESLKDTLTSAYPAGLKDIGEDDVIIRGGEAYFIDYEKTVDEEKAWDYPNVNDNDYSEDIGLITGNFDNISKQEIITEANNKMSEEIEERKYKDFENLPDYLVYGLEHTRYNYHYSAKKELDYPDYMTQLK